MTDTELKNMVVASIKSLPRPITTEAAMSAATAVLNANGGAVQAKDFNVWFDLHGSHFIELMNA